MKKIYAAMALAAMLVSGVALKAQGSGNAKEPVAAGKDKSAQERKPDEKMPKERPWEYWRHPEGYLDNQAEVLFGLIDRTLRANPASARPSAERQLALASLDALLHDTRNDGSHALHAFLDARIAGTLAELRKPATKKGLEIFKLYNDGFIVRSRSLTVGFDLCGTRGKVKYVPDSLMREAVSLCDMLFISHRDPDHADRGVVAMASEMGIPVYGPADYDNDLIIKVREAEIQMNQDETEIGQAAKDGTAVPQRKLADRQGRQISVKALPGHQDNLQNNIYIVTFPDGRTVAHCGDQWKRDDLPWMKTASRLLGKPLDVLIIDCWAMEMKAMIEGFGPRLVVSGHENEMGHTIDHREALWLTQYKFDTMALPVPAVILCWGEGFRFRR